MQSSDYTNILVKNCLILGQPADMRGFILQTNIKGVILNEQFAVKKVSKVCTRLGVLLPLLDGMQIHHRLPLSISSGIPDSSLLPIYTPGWREALESKVSC